MRTWMEETLAKLSRKPDTAAAIRYASSRWQALTCYVDDGQLEEIDNNAADRALRVIALLFPWNLAVAEIGGHT
jgi:transposase